MGLDFFNIFVSYNFGVTSALRYVLSLKFRELFWLGFVLIKSLFVILEGSMSDFCIYHDFSTNTVDILDTSRRLFEGSGADRFGVNEFMNITRTILFYKSYQPSAPNDKLLMKLIKKKLVEKGVTIMLEKKLKTIKLDAFQNLTKIFVTNPRGVDAKIRFNHLVLAIPPKGLKSIISSSSNTLVKNSIKPVDEFYKYVTKTAYLDYIPIVFFWPLSKDFPLGPWGIIRIKVSDYYKNSNKIITSITLSKPIGKNRDYLTSTEYLEKYGIEKFAEEIYHQIKEVEPTIPKYSKFVFRPTDDTSFIITDAGFLDYRTKIRSMYVVGTMNGNTTYPLTTIESAVQNANYFIESHTEGAIKIKKTAILLTFRNILYPLVYMFHTINGSLGYIFGKNSKF